MFENSLLCLNFYDCKTIITDMYYSLPDVTFIIPKFNQNGLKEFN